MKSIILLALFVSFTHSAQAEELASVQPPLSGASRSSIEWGSLFENLHAKYAFLVTGPTVQHFNGNTDGRGHNIAMRNYFSFDYDLAENTSLESGIEVRQYFRRADPKNPNRSDFQPRDPYLGVSQRNIVKGDIFSLGVGARYYIPASEYNKSNVGKAWDSGNGEASVSIFPYWKVPGSDFSFACATSFSVKIPENAPAIREEWSLKAKPLVAYRIASKWAAKVEYSTGDMRRLSNGKMTKFNDLNVGQFLIAGVSYFPNKTLSLSPALAWGEGSFRLKETQLSMYASMNLF